jgi:hypothetical protein
LPTPPPATGTTAPSGESLNTLRWDFENGVFPESPWSAEGEFGVWTVDQTNVPEGSVYSIKSPDLQSGYVDGNGVRDANATLTLDDTFSGGLMKFQILAR